MTQQSSSTTTTSASAMELQSLPRYNLDRLVADSNGESIAKGGVSCPFPWRLHECLDAVEKEGLEHIVSWQPHGRSFTVYQPKKFVELVMPRFFNQSKYASFQRQLNIYGFSRFAHGKDKGAYFHLCFVRGHRSLVRNMIRCKIKNKAVSEDTTKSMAVEDYDFYHPAWKNHFEPTVPQELMDRNQQAAVVAAAAASFLAARPFTTPLLPSNPVSPSTSAVFGSNMVGRNIFVPAPLPSPPPLIMANFSSPNNMTGSVTPSVSTSMNMTPALVEPSSAVSVVSDDLSTSLSHDDSPELLAFFEGSPFHLVGEALNPEDFEPTPFRETAQVMATTKACHGCQCCRCPHLQPSSVASRFPADPLAELLNL